MVVSAQHLAAGLGALPHVRRPTGELGAGVYAAVLGAVQFAGTRGRWTQIWVVLVPVHPDRLGADRRTLEAPDFRLRPRRFRMELILSRWKPEIRDLWSLDPTYSFVTFSVMHRGISRIRGRFDDISGHLQVGGGTDAEPFLTLNVQASSVDTGHLLRDSSLRSELFLDAVRHPTITFTGMRMRPGPNGFGRCRIRGTLAVRGIERPLAMRAEVRRSSADAAGWERLGLQAKTRVDRRLFGLGWDLDLPSICAELGRQVTVTIEAQFIREPELPPVA